SPLPPSRVVLVSAPPSSPLAAASPWPAESAPSSSAEQAQATSARAAARARHGWGPAPPAGGQRPGARRESPPFFMGVDPGARAVMRPACPKLGQVRALTFVESLNRRLSS